MVMHRYCGVFFCSRKTATKIALSAVGWERGIGAGLRGNCPKGKRTHQTQVGLRPEIDGRGTITVRSGHPNTGKVIAQATIKQGISTYGINDVMLPITDAETGARPLYFNFTADSDAPAAVLGAVLTIEILRPELAKDTLYVS